MNDTYASARHIAAQLLAADIDPDHLAQAVEWLRCYGVTVDPVVEQIRTGKHRGAALAVLAAEHGVALQVADFVPGPRRRAAALALRRVGLPVHSDDIVMCARSMAGADRFTVGKARRRRWERILAAYLLPRMSAERRAA